MDLKAWQRLELETDLRRAISDGELVVHYQPSSSCHRRRDRARSVGSLAAPGRGLVGPNDFIPHRRTDRADRPDQRFVLATACRQLTEWRLTRPDSRRRHLVNMSPRNCCAQNSSPTSSKRCARGLRPSAAIEITEGDRARGRRRDRTPRPRSATIGVRVIDRRLRHRLFITRSFRPSADRRSQDRSSFVAALGLQREETAIVRPRSRSPRARHRATGKASRRSNSGDARDLGCRYGQGYFLGRRRRRLDRPDGRHVPLPDEPSPPASSAA